MSDVGRLVFGSGPQGQGDKLQELVNQQYRTDGRCANCQTRPATVNWTGDAGTLAYSHGLYARWCERCATEAQLAHARKMAALIPELEKKLAELP